MSTRSLFPAALLIATLAGCGGSSSSSSGAGSAAFKSGFAADKAQFSRLGVDLRRAITQAPHHSNAQIATEFRSFAERTTQQAAQLRRLSPPASFKAEVDRLAAGFDQVAADMRTIVSIASSANGTRARAAGATLARDSAQVKAIDRDLTAKLGLPQTP